MLGNDHIRSLDRLAFNGLWFAEHMLGAKAMANPFVHRLVGGARRAVRRRVARHLARRGEGKVLSIDERDHLTPEEFGEQYLKRARPVVLRGAAAKWECVQKWSPAWFADNYGDDRVVVVHLEKDWNQDHDVEETNLRSVIHDMGNGRMRYARFLPLFKRHPELFEHFDRKSLSGFVGRPVKLWGQDGSGIPLRSQLFIGERNTTTSLHCAMTNNLFVQVYGRKKWILIPPSYNAVVNPPVTRAPGYFAAYLNPLDPGEGFEMFRHIDRYELTLEPGDLFYNPPFYWHHVSNPTDSIGIGIRWYWKVSARASCWTQNRLSFMATNPTMEEHLRDADDDFGINFAKVKAV
jgi:hypothetical protein